jgi:alpha-L-rhamnosidase
MHPRLPRWRSAAETPDQRADTTAPTPVGTPRLRTRRPAPARPWRSGLTVATCVAAFTLWPFAQPANAASTPWPTTPAWQNYVETPAGSTICPVAVTSTAGTVSGAQNLLCGGTGTATLTSSGSGIVLDYGKDVGGIPWFTVTGETGSPQLKAGYSESLRYLSANGDGGTPWGEGDTSRSDTYTVTGAGTITNRFTQGGERYEEISLASAGSLTLSKVGITYIADRAGYPGWFASSSDALNKIWYDGAYTAQLDSVPTGSLPGNWSLAGGVLTATGGGVGLLKQGGAWTNYTLSFDTEITSQQSGWVVRGQDASNGYVFILNAADDTGGTPNTLQELVLQNGVYTPVGNATIPNLPVNTWHTVKTTVSGSTIAVSLDGAPIASLNNNTFGTGTIGLREFGSEAANFRNVSVTNGSTTLYSGIALSDFNEPGINSLPVIVDGAKRDRAIWVGDMNIEGPTVFYSTNEAAYVKSSLQLLGSYQLSSGFVTGALAPQTALHTGPNQSGTVGTYSASYSMYWVLSLATYYRYTGDIAFLRQEWPVVQAELAWNATQLDSRGLFITNSSDGADWDFYDSEKTGAVTEYNLLYYKALQDGATLAAAVGHSNTYAQQAATLKSAINGHLYNAGTGLYTMNDTNTTAVAQDANSLAVLYGVAANPTGVLSALKSRLWTSAYGPVPFSPDTGYQAFISPFTSGYELDARLQANDTLNAEALMTTEWGHMANAGIDQTGTTWENIRASDGTPGLGTSTNLSHGWSTAPTSALSGYVLGVQPDTAGYATWLVQPHPGDLAWAEGQVPTPHGTIGVSWAGQSGIKQFSMQVTAPAGTSGTIAVPTYGAAKPVVVVNGVTAYSGDTFSPVSGVGGAHADANFVYLTGVQPGSYTVAANPGDVGVPAGYTLCAPENGTCAFTGTQSVAYGANGIFAYKTVTGGTACTGDVFGDPDFGVAKSCYTGPVTAGPSGSTYCAPENGLCAFTGSRTVAYGAETTFTRKTLTAGTPCTNTVFSDPEPGVVKSCFLTP